MNIEGIWGKIKDRKFPTIDATDERAIEKWNRAIDEEMAAGIVWAIGPFATDFWSGRRGKKPKAHKCTCPVCGVKHTLKP
jgi:hypothetical protein